ncbi:hypothetical protein IRY61_05045 [Candidatus Saccharibacteria bacterium]|nr:hypothetical protein [Candidatus Saccharibacteria bacterium]
MARKTRKTIRELASAAEAALGIEITVVGNRAAHYAEETGDGYWLTREDLAYAIACASEHGSDAYSHWCAGTGSQMSERSRRKIFDR